MLLSHTILINVGYPTRTNERGTLHIPEIPVGAATLPLLAALIRAERPGCTIRMYDEIGTPVDLAYLDALPREHTLVLLSVRTSVAYEAMLLSRRLQGLGFAVVIGGPHASACPDEVAGYANAAVHGEAEVHLANVIAAFEAGALTATTRPGLTFRSLENCDLTRSPAPETWLYRHSRSRMLPAVVEFSRGCQYRCTFCASTNLYTSTLRHKTIPQVLTEIHNLPVYPGGYRSWFFADDNFTSSHEQASRLSLAIGRRFPKARWGCAMTIASARDGRLLDALVSGGMRYVFIGFDSIVQASLQDVNKGVTRANHFSSLIQELKRRHIFVIAALVFGFDHDSPSVFPDTLSWSLENDVDVLNLNVLRPYPSSAIYAQLKREGRLLFDPWWLLPFEQRLDLVHHLTRNISSPMVTYRPKQMTERDLAAGTLWVGQQFYGARNTAQRLWRNRSGAVSLLIDGLTNYYYSRQYQSATDQGACADATNHAIAKDAREVTGITTSRPAAPSLG